MNGSLDLTLVPAFLIDDISLQYGSAGPMYGAGTMGGAIHLNQDRSIADGIGGKFFQQFGSFGERFTGISFQYGNRGSSIRVRAFSRQADNDFPYYNIYQNQEEQRKNAGISQQGLLAEYYQRLNLKQHLNIKYWLQDNSVQVPGVAAAGTISQTTQNDLFHRLVVNWNRSRSNQQFRVKTAVLSHRLEYDDKIREASLSEAISWITELENTWYFNQQRWLLVGVNHTYEQAQVENYGAEPPHRNRTSLFLSYRTQLIEPLEVSVGLRESLIDQQWAPILPSLSFSYAINSYWRLQSKVARSYNLPTFNDLYWQGVNQGNPNLLPENGWSTEIGLEVKLANQPRWKLNGSLTVFSNWLKDWIQWIPLEELRWSPRNIQQVWARGGEATINAQVSLNQHTKLSAWGDYSYTHSTKAQITNGGSRAELHKQLIYTPYHQGKASVQLDYNRWQWGIASSFIGEQFTNASNSQTLPSYSTTDFSIKYDWLINPTHQINFIGSLNNIFIQAYEVRQGFPMPGRNYQISINYQFN
jgi:iron complex outermembrane receptor protein